MPWETIYIHKKKYETCNSHLCTPSTCSLLKLLVDSPPPDSLFSLSDWALLPSVPSAGLLRYASFPAELPFLLSASNKAGKGEWHCEPNKLCKKRQFLIFVSWMCANPLSRKSRIFLNLSPHCLCRHSKPCQSQQTAVLSGILLRLENIAQLQIHRHSLALCTRSIKQSWLRRSHEGLKD